MLGCVGCFGSAALGATNKLVLAEQGATDYQIVVPDTAANPQIALLLSETGALIQRAFAANRAALAVVAEGQRDPEKPGIYLGDTQFARTQGVDVGKLEGWTYALKAVGRDLIIAGHDVPHPVDPHGLDPAKGGRLATIKGVTDFLREYAGVRFLYPGGEVGIEYMPMPEIAVPADLDVVVQPSLQFNFYGRFGEHGFLSLEHGLYFVANNYFPNIAFISYPHTYSRALPAKKYRDTHPEYFAMIGDKRTVEILPEDRQGHYCLSNPEVQDLIYQDMLWQVDQGYDMAVLGQQDGFRPCNCEKCKSLYGVGDDWGEKLWILHTTLARRLQQDRPGKKVITLIYGPTVMTPRTFRDFPDNLMMRMRLEGGERLEPWREYNVPAGIFGALGIWGAYRSLGYTPQRTPLNVAGLVKVYHANNLKGFYLDGFGNMFGMEGPSYYVFGRLFDDPENLQVGDLLEEYYTAAFREALPPMRRFFDVLNTALQLYCDLPSVFVDEYGRERGFRMTPLKLMRMIYSPDVLNDLEASLGEAEKLAVSEKVKSRLALIRLELEYTRHIAVIAHLYEAYLAVSDLALRDRLLAAIDARNAFLDTLYPSKAPSSGIVAGWPEYKLFGGHSRNAAAVPRQYRESPLVWDTAAMRQAPLPGAQRLDAQFTDAAVTMDAPAWDNIASVSLGRLPGSTQAPAGKTAVRALADRAHIYLRVECGLPDGAGDFHPVTLPEAAAKYEALEIVLDPFGMREKYYRFIAGPLPDSRYAGATGFIDDPLHPLFGLEDPAWAGK